VVDQNESEPIQLDTLHTELISVLLGRGLISLPLIILADESPLFEDAEYDFASATEADNEQETKPFILQIKKIEQYTNSLFNVTFESVASEDETVLSYAALIPRQFIQTGMMASMFLGGGRTPSILVVSESESEYIFTGDDDDLTEIVPLHHVLVQIQFPSAIDDQNLYQELSRVISQASDELVGESEGGQRFRSMPLNITSAMANEARADIIEIIMGLSRGEETALANLYKYIEPINQVNFNLLHENGKIEDVTDEQRMAVVFGDFLQKLFVETEPVTLAQEFTDDNERAEIEEFEELFDMRDRDLADAFDRMIVDYEDETNSPLIVDINSSDAEKLDYFIRPSNYHPLKRGFAKLADKINLELLYSRDWNAFDGTFDDNEEALSKGELAATYGLIVTQRLMLLADIFEEQETDGINESNIVLSSLIKNLSLNNESVSWVLGEGVKRVSQEKPLIYREFMSIVAHKENDISMIVNGPFGILTHDFGHTVMREEWSETSMIMAVEHLPEIKTFISALFAVLREREDETDEESEQCPVIEALVNTLGYGVDFMALSTQLGDAIAVMAELNAMKHTEFTHNSEPWNAFIKKYLDEFMSHSN